MGTIDKTAIILQCFIVSVFAGQFCTKYHWYSSTTTFYCSYGCCGTQYNRYCCLGGLNAAQIAGIVVGCILAVGTIITILVVVFCCCRKGRGARGQVMNPMGGVTVTSTTVGQTAYSVNTPTYPGAYPYGQPSQTTMGIQGNPQQPVPATNWEGPKPPPYVEAQ